jgi:hypothetical protein
MPDEQTGALEALPAPATEEAVDAAMDQALDQADAETDNAEEDATDATQDDGEAESVTDDGDVAAEEPGEDEPEADDSETEADADEDAKPDADEEVDDGAEIKPDKTSDDGKTLHYRAAKAHRLMKASKDMAAIEEAIPGATVEMLKGHYEAAVTAQRMTAHLQSGDPKRLGEFMDHQFGDEGTANPAAVQQLAAHLPRFLATKNPDALKQLESQVHGVLVNQLYQKASGTGESADWALAQALDKLLTGNYVVMPAAGAEGDASHKADAAFSQREAALRQGEQALAKERQNTATQQRTNRGNAISAEATSAVDAQIEKALAPVAKAYRGKRIWGHMKRDLQEMVHQAGAANSTWDGELRAMMDTAVTNGSDQSKRALISKVEQLAGPVIRRNLKDIVKEATGIELKRSATAHTKLKAGAQKREPPPSGRPSSRTQDLAKQFREGKLTEDQLLDATLPS